MTNDTDSSAVRGALERTDSGEFIPKVSDDAVLNALIDAYPEPLSATEVGDEINASRTTAHNRLERFVEQGVVSTKKVGARARVYWLSPE